MQIIRGLHNLRPEHKGCVATIGNFDGVHLGHRAVFEQLLKRADETGLPATVVTFEPQPMEFFAPNDAPARLTRLRDKLDALHNIGVERVVVLEFGKKLAAMHAQDFVHRLLIEGLGIKQLYVGDDFHFGKNREGDFSLLQKMGQQNGFDVENMYTFAMDEARVSSTRIRRALAAGDLQQAAEYLGRPYRICGRVGHGDARGRTIGFPTANLDLHRKVSPLRGVYAVKVYGLEHDVVYGVANIGNRPTVEGDSRYLLEVNLFNFDRQIYGHHVQVEFLKRLRDEMKFDSFDLLRQQIGRDAVQAREFLGLEG